MGLRVGFGIDAHRKIQGRPLVLGGVAIPADFGLEAHSDGDVLAHAILDAVLGAANLGDKGTHFPPTDPTYKDIRSTLLLSKAVSLLRENNGRIVNVDASIVCENPRLGPYISSMKTALSEALCCTVSQISVKATTTEKLGFTGREEGLAAMAVVLIEIPDNSHDR